MKQSLVCLALIGVMIAQTHTSRQPATATGLSIDALGKAASFVQQKLDAASQARDRNDAEQEVKELLPAYERVLPTRSVEWIELLAGMLVAAYKDLEQPDSVINVMKRADAAIRRIAGPDGIERAQFLAGVAATEFELGRSAEAKATFAEAVKKMRTAAGPDSVLLQHLLEAEALLDEGTQDGKSAADAQKEAEAIQERRQRKNDFGHPPDPHIKGLLERAGTAERNKDDVKASDLVGQALAAAEKLDISNPQRAATWWDAAIVYNSPPVTRPDLVDKYLKRALELSEAALGDKRIPDVTRLSMPMLHLQGVLRAMYTLSGACNHPGRAFDCESLDKHYLEVLERALGPDHPVVAGQLFKIGSDLYFAVTQEQLKKQGGGSADDARDPRLQQALEYCRRALAIYEKAFSKDDSILTDDLDKVAEIYYAMNDAEAARATRDRSTRLRDGGPAFASEEEIVKYDVKKLRLLMRFDEADDRVEEYRGMHPGSKLR